MPTLDKRYRCYYTGTGDDYVCESTAWDSWIRWVVLAIIIILFFLLFACCSITTARRRRRRGLTPYYGTGWTAPAHGQPYYGNGQPHNQQWAQPAPPYTAQPEYYQHNGFYGHQQNGVELQNQGPASPQPAHPRGGDNVYEPPAGPPPKKGDGIVR